MEQPDKNLDWFISEKDKYLIVSFSGTMTEDTSSKLIHCEEEVKKRNAKCIVLNFFNIDEMTRGCMRQLAHLEKLIRDKPAKLRICFLKPDHETFLVREGIIRPNEITGNLMQALKSFDSPEVHKKRE